MIVRRLAFSFAFALALTLGGATGGMAQEVPSPAAAQCAAEVAVTCPARREITAVAGWAPESYTAGIAWTGVRRLGAYIRLFPGLEPKPRSVPNATVRAESLTEFGVAYRLTAPLTIGAGWGRYARTDKEYGSIDPITFQPSLVSVERSSESGPAVFIAYAFHPPSRAIGFAASASLGVAGSGVSVGTTLRFPKFRNPIGI